MGKVGTDRKGRGMTSFVKKTLAMLVLLGAMGAMSACNTHHVSSAHAPGSKIVRTWYRPNGCFVRRVVYPCYNAQGNLKVQVVRCPDGQAFRRQWLHPDGRCGGQSTFIP